MDYRSGVEIISINILKRMDELQYFYQKEKQELGITVGYGASELGLLR